MYIEGKVLWGVSFMDHDLGYFERMRNRIVPNRELTRSARKRYPCLRYNLLPTLTQIEIVQASQIKTHVQLIRKTTAGADRTKIG